MAGPRLTGEALDRQLAYWTHHLADPPVDLPLPYRGRRPALATGATYRGGRIELALDAELTRRLRALAHRSGATLFMVLLAALRALLARYTGQRDLCIATVVANRDRREIEGVIGMFVNTLVLRGSVHGRDRFVDLLARERDLALAAYAHAHAPFERVVDALGLERRLDRVPLIQVMCVDQGDTTGEAVLPGVLTEPFRIDLEIENFDLSLDTCERAGVREVTIGYNAELFDRATIATLVARYERLLVGIADRPELPMSQLELLAPGERATLFDDPARRVVWEPRVPTSPAMPTGVIARIERWMTQTPDAPAILWQGDATSYRELDVRSARPRRAAAPPRRRPGSQRRRGRGARRALRSSASSPRCAPVARTCRSSPTCRTNASGGSSKTPRRWRSCATAHRRPRSPATRGRSSGSTRRGQTRVTCRICGPPDRGTGRARGAARRARVHHLHLRLDRPAQGRHGHPPRLRCPAALDAGRLPARRRRTAACSSTRSCSMRRSRRSSGR